MYEYRNDPTAVNTVHENSQLLSGWPKYTLNRDSPRTHPHPSPSKEPRSYDRPDDVPSADLPIRARFTENLRVTGSWAKTDAPTDEGAKGDWGFQNVSFTVITDPIVFDTRGLEQVYLSVLRPENSSCSIGRSLKYRSEIWDIRNALKGPSKFPSGSKLSLRVEKCVVHTEAALSRETIKSWNASQSFPHGATEQNDGEARTDLPSILGETDVSVIIQIFPPWGDPEAEDLFARPSRYGKIDDLDQLVEQVDEDWGMDSDGEDQ